MQTRIIVKNDNEETVREVLVTVTSEDGISTTAAIEDAATLVKSLINRWMHREGVRIQITTFMTSGDKDLN